MPDPIVVKGLTELRAALKELKDIEGKKEFKAAGYDIAANVVSPKAKGTAAGLGPMWAKAAETLRPAKIATGGGIRFGSGFGGAFGAEFGSGKYHQFKPWRGSGAGAGYFLWPTIRDSADEILATYERNLQPLYDRLFPDR
jgi:hypothetical protein